MIDISKYANNMAKLREDAKSFEYEPYPMCIRTYKNRVNSLLGNLKEFGDREIHIFLYDFDYEESGYKKYGWENFEVKYLFTDNVENLYDGQLNELEQKYIIEYNTVRPFGYNLTSGGDGKYVFTDETKNKISARAEGCEHCD